MKLPSLLVVDDNPDHLELTVLALAGCVPADSIATAADGVEALHYVFARSHALPKLVILDLKLVRLHGLDVIKALRADSRTTGLPIVVHSSSGERADVQACYAHGANGYVRKAADFDELRRRMRAVCDYWLTVNEPAPLHS